MQILLLLSFLAACATTLAVKASYNCRPGASCWPSESQWKALNVSLGGHLIRTIPWAAPCYPDSGYYDFRTCSEISSNYTTGLKRASVYGALEAIQYEVCGDKGCLLQSLAPGLPPLGQSCDLGRLSAYHVDARNSSHIVTAIGFAKQHNIRLTVKNTGHDYLGRSAAPNSLAIWTHHLQAMHYHTSYSGRNCPSVQKLNVGEISAGVLAQDAYNFFEDYGMSVCGGNAASVGLAGGFGQGGGHGIFTPTYGLFVDQAIEFDVVTADGEFRVINKCNDPDLFWAMRGGGGGTYGILVSYKFQLYPAKPIHMHHFKAEFSLLGSIIDNSVLKSLVTAHIQNQVTWSDNGIAGRFYYGVDFVEFHSILPYNDNGTRLRNLTEPWLKKIRSIKGLKITFDEYHSYSKYSDYNAVAQESAARLTPNGFAANVGSRLVPRSLFTSDSQKKLVNTVLEGLETNRAVTSIIAGLPVLEILMTTPVHNPDPDQTTSVHPAWRSALWHAVFLGGWIQGTSMSSQQSTIQRVHDSAKPLRDLTPGGGSYANEDSILVEEWESTFFGSHYERLLSIKNRYDPTRLFDCYKCVGWRGGSDQAYSCYGPNPTGGTILD